jgi:hypothetical protein
VGGAPERSLQRERVCGSGGSSLRGANDQLRFTGSLVGPMAACSAVACSTRRRAACVACSIQLRGRLAPRHFYLYHRGTSDDSSTRQRTAQQQGRPHQLRHVSHQQLLLSCRLRLRGSEGEIARRALPLLFISSRNSHIGSSFRASHSRRRPRPRARTHPAPVQAGRSRHRRRRRPRAA